MASAQGGCVMSAPVLVAGCAFSIGAGGLFGSMPWLRPSAGMCPRRGTFFSCVAKKRRQKKATPLSASPALRYGATCGARGRCALRNSLRAGALRSNSRSESVHEARVSCGTRATPPAALLGAYRGDGERTSTRAIASLGPVSRAQAPRAAQTGSSAAKTRVAVRLFSAVHPLWLRLRRGGCGVAWASKRPCFVI